MGLLVGSLRRHGELIIDDEIAAQLMAISAATIDGRLAGDRAELVLKDCSLTKPGTPLGSDPDQDPGPTGDWTPGGDNNGMFAGLSAPPTSPPGVPRPAPCAELERSRRRTATHPLALPFHLFGIHHSDNGSGFINYHLLRWCTARGTTGSHRKRTATKSGQAVSACGFCGIAVPSR